jgi:hypothetical protein
MVKEPKERKKIRNEKFAENLKISTLESVNIRGRLYEHDLRMNEGRNPKENFKHGTKKKTPKRKTKIEMERVG